MKDIFVVGGTFDRYGGKASRVASLLALHLGEASLLNGGHIDVLDVLDYTKFKTLVWMPNIDNSEDKILPSLKVKNPHMLLVSSKRVIEKDYKESDVIGRLLASHSNLGVMITRGSTSPEDIQFRFQLLDPLGNSFANTTDIPELGFALKSRINTLNMIERWPSKCIDTEAKVPPIEDAFIEVVRELGAKFSGFVNAVNPNRLLGNAATRCSRGFPAVLTGERIYVSRRNVDKATLSKEDFVDVFLERGYVAYTGPNKPSVDSPIQLRLFEIYPNVKYIVHGHVYVKGAKQTSSKLPCGSMSEHAEVRNLFPDRESVNFAVNLWGHGCLLLANDLEFLRSIPLVGRPFPETQ